MEIHNPNCDGGHCFSSRGEVAVLPLPGEANVHLCRACWVYEMRWRIERNRELAEDSRYPIPNFDEAKEILP